jgi:hypothetical protein
MLPSDHSDTASRDDEDDDSVESMKVVPAVATTTKSTVVQPRTVAQKSPPAVEHAKLPTVTPDDDNVESMKVVPAVSATTKSTVVQPKTVTQKPPPTVEYVKLPTVTPRLKVAALQPASSLRPPRDHNTAWIRREHERGIQIKKLQADTGTKIVVDTKNRITKNDVQWGPVRVKGKPDDVKKALDLIEAFELKPVALPRPSVPAQVENATDVPPPFPTLAVPSSAPLQRTPPKHPVEATSPPPSSAPPRPGPSTHSQHTVMPPPLASPLQRPPSMQSMVSPKAPTPRVTQQPIGTPLSKTPKTSIAALLCSNNSCFKGIRKSLVSGCTHKTLQHWMICAMRSTTTPY